MELKEFLQAMLGGKDMEGRGHMPTGDQWRPLDVSEALTMFGNSPSLVRIAPTLKPVDMSVFIDSGIDCEFSHSSDFTRVTIGRIGSIAGETFNCHTGNSFTSHSKCRPRLDHWHSMNNCPDINIVQKLEMAGFDVTEDDCHIKVSLSDSRCYPWEAS